MIEEDDDQNESTFIGREAKTKIVSLDQKIVSDETPAQSALRKQQWWMTCVVSAIFVLLNGAIIALILMQMAFDNDMIREKLMTANDRVVDAKVFMALIGGTVIQTGVAVKTIMGHLFPGVKPKDDN